MQKSGFEVVLVDPRKLKTVPGRSRMWLTASGCGNFYTYDLLAAAFRPDEQTRVLRAYLRQRALLVEQAAEHIRHMQKAMTQMNLKLGLVQSQVATEGELGASRMSVSSRL